MATGPKNPRPYTGPGPAQDWYRPCLAHAEELIDLQLARRDLSASQVVHYPRLHSDAEACEVELLRRYKAAGWADAVIIDHVLHLEP